MEDFMIKTYSDSKEKIMAIAIPHDYKVNGIEFCTRDEEYMQVACMGHPAGHTILPHYHNRITREIDYTCETLIIRKGSLKVSLYENQIVCHCFVISSGDVLTLFSGGHGFEVIESVDMIEIKQGPYIGESDKTRF